MSELMDALDTVVDFELNDDGDNDDDDKDDAKDGVILGPLDIELADDELSDEDANSVEATFALVDDDDDDVEEIDDILLSNVSL